MTVIDQRAVAPPIFSGKRRVAALAGLALAASVALVLRRLAPGAPAIIPIGLAGLSGLSVAGLAFTLDEASLWSLTLGALAGVGLIVLAALSGPEAALRLMSFASMAFGIGLAAWLARTASRGPRLSLRLAALYAAALAGLCAYAAYLVLVSRDLMIADFMTYRGVSVMVARLADAGNWPLLFSAAAQSITQDYAWGPAVVPGLALALTEPTSRAVYTFALLALYAAPALLALAILSRDLARRAGLSPHRGRPEPGAIREPRPEAPRSGPEGRVSSYDCRRQREHPSRRLLFGRLRMRSQGSLTRHGEAAILALAIVAVFFAYPAAMAIAARGMPDVGGLVLVVCALQARRAPRAPARAARGSRRACRADDAPRRFGSGADPVCDVRLPALVCVRRGGNCDHARGRGRLGGAGRRRALPLEGCRRGDGARPSCDARALKPGHRRLAAEPGRA